MKRQDHGCKNKTHNIYIFVVLSIITVAIAVIPASSETTLVKNALGTVLVVLFIRATLARSGLQAIRSKFRFHPLGLPLLSYVVYCVISLAWTRSPDLSFGELVRIIPGLLLCIVYPWSDATRHHAIIDRVLVIMACLVSLYGLIQWFDMDPLQWNRNVKEGVFSTFGHPNILAPFLIAGAAAAIGLYKSNHPTGKPVSIISLSLILPAFILTFSKGAFLGAFLAAIICLTWFGNHPNPYKRLGYPALIAVLAIAAVLLHPQSFKRLMEANQFRIATWQGSIEAIRQETSLRKIFGTGLGTYMQTFDKYRDPDYLRKFKNAGNLVHAHSEYLETAVETGAFGMSLFLWIFTCYFFWIYLRNRQGLLSTRGKLLCGAVIAILTHNFVSVNLRWFSSWTVLFLLVVMSLDIDLSPSEASPASPVRKIGISLAAAVYLAVSLWHISHEMISDYWYFKGTAAMKSNPGRAVNSLIKASGMIPADNAIKYDLAYCYSNTGEYDQAIGIYAEILDSHPNYQRSHRNIAVNYQKKWLKSGDPDMLGNAILHMQLGLAHDLDEENLLTMGVLQENAHDYQNAFSYYSQYVDAVFKLMAQVEHLSNMRQNSNESIVIPRHLAVHRTKLQDVIHKLSVLDENRFREEKSAWIKRYRDNPMIHRILKSSNDL